MKDIQEAFDVFVNNGISKSKISILHCNTEYPTPMKDVNLLAMLAIKKKFKTSVGYSDHTMGIEVPIAAGALGAGHGRKLFKHILPNVTHIIIIFTSLQFQIAIKSEVILSYLGLGVSGQPSWGTMIDDAKMELARGVYWQLLGATVAMFFVVLAFNILGDALRDALDPKLKGKG